MHKTGSSSIQHSLHHNLNSERFTYPDLGAANHSIALSSLFRDISTTHEQQARLKQTLVENIEKSNDTMIISAEVLSMFSKETLVEVRDFFLQYFHEIQVVGYVRTPKSFMESFFQQRIKGGQLSFDLDTLIYPHYREKFEKFDEVFGQKHVELWKFDPVHLYEGNVVLDFCQKLGIPMKKEQTIRINESLSKEEVSVLYTAGQTLKGELPGPETMQRNMRILKKIRSIGEHKFRFSPSLIEPILKKNRDDIQWMEERLGTSLQETMKAGNADIRCEDDLLNPTPETVSRLRAIAGVSDPVTKEYGSIQEEVSALIRILHRKQKKNTLHLTPALLARKIKKEKKKGADKFNEEEIAFIIEQAFAQIRQKVRKMDNKELHIPKLGRFRQRDTESPKDDMNDLHTPIIFTLPGK